VEIAIDGDEANILVPEGDVEVCPEGKKFEEDKGCVVVAGGECAFVVLGKDEVKEQQDLRDVPKEERPDLPIIEKDDELGAGFQLPGANCLVVASTTSSTTTASIVGGVAVGVVVVEGTPASD
jgi:hypothetical protein